MVDLKDRKYLVKNSNETSYYFRPHCTKPKSLTCMWNYSISKVSSVSSPTVASLKTFYLINEINWYLIVLQCGAFQGQSWKVLCMYVSWVCINDCQVGFDVFKLLLQNLLKFSFSKKSHKNLELPSTEIWHLHSNVKINWKILPPHFLAFSKNMNFDSLQAQNWNWQKRIL